MWSPPKPWEISSNNFRNPPPTSTSTSYRPVRGVRQVRRTNMAENDGKTAPALPPRPASRQSPSYSNYGTIPQHAPNRSSKCVLILNLVVDVPLCLAVNIIVD